MDYTGQKSIWPWEVTKVDLASICNVVVGKPCRFVQGSFDDFEGNCGSIELNVYTNDHGHGFQSPSMVAAHGPLVRKLFCVVQPISTLRMQPGAIMVPSLLKRIVSRQRYNSSRFSSSSSSSSSLSRRSPWLSLYIKSLWGFEDCLLGGFIIRWRCSDRVSAFIEDLHILLAEIVGCKYISPRSSISFSNVRRLGSLKLSLT